MSILPLPAAAPTSQGVDPRGLLALLDAVEAEGIDLHSLAVARHGRVVAAGWWAPFTPERVHLGYSLSKSLTATAVGFLVQEGRLGVDDLVLDLLPQVRPGSVDPRWSRVRVRHALSMTLGHDHETVMEAQERAAALGDRAEPMLDAIVSVVPDREPGSVFAYNQPATYLLSRVVEQVSGTPVSEVLRTRLLEPLGLPPVPWHTDPAGHELGYSGAHVPTATILAVAQLHLDGGRWQGRRLLDPAWVAEATRGQGPVEEDPSAGPDWRQGYGWSFWQARHGYRGDGAFGQFAIVLPEQDVAIAITSETEDMQRVLDLLWEHLLPALAGEALPDEGADAELAARLDGLAQPAPASTGPAPAGPMSFSRSPDSDLPRAYAGVHLERDGSGWAVRMTHGAQDVVVPCGDGRWASSRVDFGRGTQAVEAAGGWGADGRFRAEVLLIETPHRILLDADPASGVARIAWRRVPLTGRDPAALLVPS